MLSRIRALPGLLAIRVVTSLTAILAGAGFCFGPASWHSGGSYYFISLLHIPWQAYGFYLIVAGILIVFQKTRPIGYLMGAMLYTFFAIAAWLAVLGGVHGSILFFGHLPHWLQLPAGKVGGVFAPCNITTIAVLYWSATRWALYDQIDPERKASWHE